ncbi:MAG: 30S ribosome-binding factor RbfA [Negativicoccus succinicivorans]|uniref:30S ribosome-binding factor RbfA n=1 Tax=Negativicoccus succinicivorans TaxID=620903 RepID=UPI0029122A70|nr:30S ribosome-binding factor RbfA [Negativicoccus succinicivorans]MDU5914580.1 30S ribosome-binding factor RbfA [Negativicoccus succinicivorans]
MSQLRVRKMQEFIKQEIGQMLLRDLKDTRLGFVTVTEVAVTGDLREATVYVSLFGSDEEKEKSFAALQNATGFIRTELGKRLQVRHTPEITFAVDRSIDYGDHIERVLKSIKDKEESQNRLEGVADEDQ